MYKVAFVNITLNEPYWQYYKPMVDSAKKFFLKGHQVDFFTWSDMPENMANGAKIIPTEPFEWPLPTLFRYHLFLREKELLSQYDYIFYCDTDMEFVSPVGDEILGPDLTGAQHPMYATARIFIPPYEPNPQSQAFIKRPGRVIEKNGKKMFEPLYFAGGFQGGRSEIFIQAMEKMKEMIDLDFGAGYIPIWNDETVWNKYLFDNPPSTVLSPSYVYPDSMNSIHYKPVWGRNYVPKIITITKKFSLTKEAGVAVQQRLEN